MSYSETKCSFAFEKGNVKTSNVSLLYCHLVLSAKRGLCIEIFNWDMEKVSVVKRCPLRTVPYTEVSL